VLETAAHHRRQQFYFSLFSLRAILYWFDHTQGVSTMEWTTPKHEEIDLNCEISSYANAEL
jgi:hypothetical protein